MTIGIYKNNFGSSSAYTQKLIDYIEFNGIDYELLDIKQPDFWKKISKLDFFYYRWLQISHDTQLASSILPVIEHDYKIPLYPDLNTSWHYDDKIKQYYLMQKYGYPIVPTYIFWDKAQALQWLKTATFPLVFKLKTGAASENVVLVENYAYARQLVMQMFEEGIYPEQIPGKYNVKYNSLFTVAKFIGKKVKRFFNQEEINPNWEKNRNYTLFQKFLPHNLYDTRIFVLGQRAFGIRRFNRSNDFRASGSGKIDYNPKNINPEFIKLALQISIERNFQSMNFDFLYDEKGQPWFCEISYTTYDYVIHNCPGYWDADMNWHEGHFWPQQFILEDLLKTPIKIPETKTTVAYKPMIMPTKQLPGTVKAG